MKLLGQEYVKSFAGGLERSAGRLLTALLPSQTERVRSNPEAARGILGRLLRAGVRARLGERGDLSALASYHWDFWKRGGRVFHADHLKRFETHFLGHHVQIIDVLEQYLRESEVKYSRLFEIGCGSGQVLEYMAARFPELDSLTGVDLSPEQVRYNRQRYPCPRLQFVAANALDWVGEAAEPYGIYLTNGGVLEYFTGEQLLNMFRQIAGRCAPSLFVAIEPLDARFNLATDTESRTYGSELSFTHNYPVLLQRAGFKVHTQREVTVGGYRWLLLLAATREMKRQCHEALIPKD